MATDLQARVWITHPTDGRTDVTGRVTGLVIDRGADRRTGRTKAGVCRLTSSTLTPWVGPWSAPGTWYEGDLNGAQVTVELGVHGTRLDPVFTGFVDSVAHGAAEEYSQVTIRCLDLWGARIAHDYVDVPAITGRVDTRARFRAVLAAAGYTGVVGPPSTRYLAPTAAAKKQRLVQVLQEIADSENGFMFVDRHGFMHFEPHPVRGLRTDVVVADTAVDGAATPLRSPQVVLDRDRLVNAVIVIAGDATGKDDPYRQGWGTADTGAVADDTGYTTPWDSTSGQGTGVGGATEIVRGDPASISKHGRQERRVQTGLSPVDAAGLADELIRERATLRPTIPDIKLVLEHEQPAVALRCVRLDLADAIQVQVHARTQAYLYADVAPIERIRWRIRPRDQAAGTVAVTADFALYRGTAPAWWTLGVSSLAVTTILGAAGLATHPGRWVDTDIVDHTGLDRVAQQTVARYATIDAENTGEQVAYASPVPYRFTVNSATRRLRQFDAANNRWTSIGRFT